MINNTIVPFYNQFAQTQPPQQDIPPKPVNDGYYEHQTGYFFKDKKITIDASPTSSSSTLLK